MKGKVMKTRAVLQVLLSGEYFWFVRVRSQTQTNRHDFNVIVCKKITIDSNGEKMII